MSRHFPNWLQGYCDHTEHLEAPTNLHFFSGVAAIAGVLRRHVWFDQGYFNWYPNFYIIIVAKPGIVNKSTSIGVAMDLLREVPGVHIGPSSVTWQALVQHMGNVAEQVDINGEFHTQSCLTFVASELGTLIDFHNREMIDVLVDLWDGKTGSWDKMSKMSGKESIVNPWISFIAGTTPAWLSDNVPEGAIGGGFASRCIFVYGAEKRHLVAYPKNRLSPDFYERRLRLIADLEQMSLLRGEYKLDPEARVFGEEWYHKLWTQTPEHLRGDRFEGYLARKQTHMHKLAMVSAAAQRDHLILLKEDLTLAEHLLESVENDMILALDRVGRSKSGINTEDFVAWILTKGRVTRDEAVRYLTRYVELDKIDNTISTAISAGYLSQVQTATAGFLAPTERCRELLGKPVASPDLIQSLVLSADSPAPDV